MAHELVINEPTCMRCGNPRGQCECRRTTNRKAQPMDLPDDCLPLPEPTVPQTNAFTDAKDVITYGDGARLPDTWHDYQKGHTGLGLTPDEMLAKAGLPQLSQAEAKEVEEEMNRRLGLAPPPML